MIKLKHYQTIHLKERMQRLIDPTDVLGGINIYNHANAQTYYV